jgi:curved DNA-binding protein CbpA
VAGVSRCRTLFGTAGRRRHRGYRELGVSPECSDEELKASFRKLALRWHPDRFSSEDVSVDKLRSAEKFRKAHEAFRAVTQERRQQQQQQQSSAAGGDSGGRSAGWFWQQPTPSPAAHGAGHRGSSSAQASRPGATAGFWRRPTGAGGTGTGAAEAAAEGGSNPGEATGGGFARTDFGDMFRDMSRDRSSSVRSSSSGSSRHGNPVGGQSISPAGLIDDIFAAASDIRWGQGLERFGDKFAGTREQGGSSDDGGGGRSTVGSSPSSSSSNAGCGRTMKASSRPPRNSAAGTTGARADSTGSGGDGGGSGSGGSSFRRRARRPRPGDEEATQRMGAAAVLSTRHADSLAAHARTAEEALGTVAAFDRTIAEGLGVRLAHYTHARAVARAHTHGMHRAAVVSRA